MTSICLIPTLFAYGLAALCFLIEGWREAATLRRWALRAYLFGLLLHTIYIPFAIWWTHGAFLSAPGGSLGLLAWTSAVAFGILARNPRWQHLARVFVPLVFLLSLDAVAAQPHAGVFAVPNRLLLVHLGVAMVAVAICLMAFVTTLIFFYLQRRLKLRRPAARWLVLPSLPAIERTVVHLLLLGFIALTATLATGAFLGTGTGHGWWSVVAWGIYGLVLHGHYWQGRRAQRWLILSCAGFAVIVGSFLEVHGL